MTEEPKKRKKLGREIGSIQEQRWNHFGSEAEDSETVPPLHSDTATQLDRNTVRLEDRNTVTPLNRETVKPEDGETVSLSSRGTVQPLYSYAVDREDGETLQPSHSEAVKLEDSQTVKPEDGETAEKQEKTSFYLSAALLEKLDDLAHDFRKQYGKRINRNDIVRHLVEQVTLVQLEGLKPLPKGVKQKE